MDGLATGYRLQATDMAKSLIQLALWFRTLPTTETQQQQQLRAGWQSWLLESRASLPRQEELHTLLGLSDAEYLAVRAGHGRLNCSEHLPDFCLGCHTSRQALEGGKLRYACPACSAEQQQLGSRVARHQALAQIAMFTGYELPTVEWLLLRYVNKSLL